MATQTHQRASDKPMTFIARIAAPLFLAAPFALLTFSASANEAAKSAATVKPVLTKALPDVAGKEVMMLTVEYAPGGASPAHRHSANTFVYVLEGAVVMAVAGGDEITVNAGETFYESPTDVHSVSRNASATAPARFLVFFVKDAGAAPTQPVAETAQSGARNEP